LINFAFAKSLLSLAIFWGKEEPEVFVLKITVARASVEFFEPFVAVRFLEGGYVFV